MNETISETMSTGSPAKPHFRHVPVGWPVQWFSHGLINNRPLAAVVTKADHIRGIYELEVTMGILKRNVYWINDFTPPAHIRSEYGCFDFIPGFPLPIIPEPPKEVVEEPKPKPELKSSKMAPLEPEDPKPEDPKPSGMKPLQAIVAGK